MLRLRTVKRKIDRSDLLMTGWAKFGKPIWSTRVIVDDLQPVWEETAFVLVGPEEMNAEERLRLQLWDSDRTSADDDLGRLELELKELMHDPEYRAIMKDRSDGFQALEGSQAMPGTLDWAVGYYSKTRIQAEQLSKQQIEPVNDLKELKERVSRDVEKKLREAVDRDESTEKDQQKAQDLKNREGTIKIYLFERPPRGEILITPRCYDLFDGPSRRISYRHSEYPDPQYNGPGIREDQQESN